MKFYSKKPEPQFVLMQFCFPVWQMQLGNEDWSAGGTVLWAVKWGASLDSAGGKDHG